MLRSLLFVTLLALPTSCGANSPAPVSPRPCVVPPAPSEPTLEIGICGDYVCITPESAVTLATWVHEMREVERALARCSLVVRG